MDPEQRDDAEGKWKGMGCCCSLPHHLKGREEGLSDMKSTDGKTTKRQTGLKQPIIRTWEESAAQSLFAIHRSTKSPSIKCVG